MVHSENAKCFVRLFSSHSQQLRGNTSSKRGKIASVPHKAQFSIQVQEMNQEKERTYIGLKSQQQTTGETKERKAKHHAKTDNLFLNKVYFK